VVVVSDHGFYFGGEGPDRPSGVQHGGAIWHKRGGVFIARGPEFVRGDIGDIEALEIVPALLYLAGLPVAEDMPAGFPDRLFREDLPGLSPPVYISSYEDGSEKASGPLPSSKYDALVIEELKALGYLSPETVNYHINRGEIYMRAGNFIAAEQAFRKALALSPGLPGPSVSLARALLARDACGEALKALDGVSPANGNERNVLTTRMHVLKRCGREAEAGEILEALHRLFPDDPDFGDTR
jgi:tetratricopeptide (TPR) repeat protein